MALGKIFWLRTKFFQGELQKMQEDTKNLTLLISVTEVWFIWLCYFISFFQLQSYEPQAEDNNPVRKAMLGMHRLEFNTIILWFMFYLQY